MVLAAEMVAGVSWCAHTVRAIAMAKKVWPVFERFFRGVRAVLGCTMVATVFAMVRSYMIAWAVEIVSNKVALWNIAKILFRNLFAM